MKILLLVFHPDLSRSRVNHSWKSQLEASGKVTTSRDMYAEYPDFQMDVEKEQALLLTHDRIVLQFPMYWNSMPPLLKKWLDDVLQYNFAYGSKGDKLKGKDLQLFVSVGGRAGYYSGFDIFSTVPELLRPFQLTANFVRMNYLMPEWIFEADSTSMEKVQQKGQRLVDIVDDPASSDPRSWLNKGMVSDADELYEQVG